MSRQRVNRFHEGARLQQVNYTILRYGTDYVFDRGFVGSIRRSMQQWLYRPEPPVRPLPGAVKARLLLEGLGPVYVKIGQLISSQSNVLPGDWAAELAKLQSDVKPFPYEDARAALRAELGADPEDLYARFEPMPLAAASLAQVHEAQLQDGTTVAVKIQRPNIDTEVRADIQILRRESARMERRVAWAREIGAAVSSTSSARTFSWSSTTRSRRSTPASSRAISNRSKASASPASTRNSRLGAS